MAVYELIVLDLDTGHAGRLDQMIAVRLINRLIYIRKKSVQSLGNRIKCPVEQTDHTFLFKRILHLLLRDSICLALPG